MAKSLIWVFLVLFFFFFQSSPRDMFLLILEAEEGSETLIHCLCMCPDQIKTET